MRISSSQHSGGEHAPGRVRAAEQTGDAGVQVRRRAPPDPHLAQRRSTAAGHHLKKKEDPRNDTYAQCHLLLLICARDPSILCRPQPGCVSSPAGGTYRSTWPSWTIKPSTPAWPAMWPAKPHGSLIWRSTVRFHITSPCEAVVGLVWCSGGSV